MSSLLVENGFLITQGESNAFIGNGAVYAEEGIIVEAGAIPTGKYTADKTIDAQGRLIMPGLVNVHHHLYSTLARGWTPPGEPAADFKEILERVWWKLDAALDEDDVYFSAIIPLINAIREGCTTVVDHHASPGCVDGSLDIIEKAFREAGLNGCLCYEVTDRNVQGQGIEENVRFIEKCKEADDGQIAALFGMHALLTLGTKTLERCAEEGHNLDVGFHVHVAESEHDGQVTMEKYQRRLMDRFLDFGLLGEKCLFAHGIHFEAREMDLMKSSDSMLVSNPESNMNNGLAISPILELLKRGVLVGLGTDGMSSHMISQARALYLAQRAYRRDPRVAFVEACDMLFENNARIANRMFKEPRGALEAGQLADIIVVDYHPFTPLNENTFCGHALFGLSFARVATTICRGRVLMEEGRIGHVDEKSIRTKAVERAEKLWARIE